MECARILATERCGFENGSMSQGDAVMVRLCSASGRFRVIFERCHADMPEGDEPRFTDHGRRAGFGRPKMIVFPGWFTVPRGRLFLGAVLISLAGVSPLRGDVLSATGQSWPTSAVALDESARAIAEVNQAIKSFEKRDLDACLQQLATAVKAHPELPPAHALLAKLAFLSNQAAMIRPALERAVVEDPEHPEVYILFGNLALLENRATDAALHFEKARALAAAQRWTAEQRQRFERFCHQGNALLAEGRGDWKAARAALEGWLALEPANARARQRLGKALFSLGQSDAAYAELQKAAKDDAALEPPAISMGWLYTAAGDMKKGEEWMNFAVKTTPDSLPVRIGMASWLVDQSRADEAQSHADAAAKINPKAIEVQRLLGLAARERKDLATAERVFQAMSLESPGDSWARNQLALVLAEQPDEAKHRRALELAELSVRQNPNALNALVTLGTVPYRLKRLDDAEKVLQAVLNSGQGNSDAAYIMALVQSERGHPENARKLLETAVSVPGQFIFRKEAQQWLERLKAKPK
jgi:tetratricopeptide (TPR) repeat protein